MDTNKLPITLCLYNQAADERIDNLFESYTQYFEAVEIIDETELMEVGDTKTSKWNYLAYNAKTPWILFIEGNEILETSNLSYLHELNNDIWSSCIVSVQTNKGIESYYQNRLVPTGIEGIFQGRELPDTSNFILENNVKFLNQSIDIQSDVIPWEHIDISAERVSLNSPINLFLY